ncbi:hypothetical protein DM82_5615 [Burkholderia oklahomensis]|uniref:Uncharacterized protein n=1 Tax=Burkholderia oklahomensis TaxID=342113 RepID=A0AAI8FR22_9BURK|nr:hypothetical protein DM82_5615 [Burkholderia oklahomensis]AOI39004.1 hypothetical protein WG70_04810 [Burkholderia oklahomensis EO147]KUY52142.1 hypothetical protein WG70_14815 [Burkholderia oklahomensis EO147]
MNLAMSKVAAAEQILNPVLLDVENKLQRDVAAINDLSGDADLDKAIGSLADTLTGALLLELLLVWLVKNDALSFWRGVFEAMVSDVASFDSHLPRVRDYVKKSILTVVDLDSIIKDARARLEAEVARITALLQQAVQNVDGCSGYRNLWCGFKTRKMIALQQRSVNLAVRIARKRRIDDLNVLRHHVRR